MIIFASIIFLISVWLLVIANSYHMVLYSRVLQGLAVGIVSIVIPLYLAEIIPARLRGRGVGLFQLFLTSGILLGTLVNYWLESSENWRLMFGLAAVPALVLLFGALFLPNSPRWLMLKNKKDQALKVLNKMNSSSDAKIEFETMSKIIEQDKKKLGKSWSKFFKSLLERKFLLPLLLVDKLGDHIGTKKKTQLIKAAKEPWPTK